MLPAAFLLLGAAVFAVAQQSSGTKQNTRPAPPISPVTAETKSATSPKAPEDLKPTRFEYEFTQPQFFEQRRLRLPGILGDWVAKDGKLHQEMALLLR